MTAVSIFNDVIGPVMRGPSSSHCAAALRIGRLARETHSLVAISTGGGMIEVQNIDGVAMSMEGGYHETLIWPTSPEIEKRLAERKSKRCDSCSC